MSDLNVVAATPLIITSGAGALAMGAGLLPGRGLRRHAPTAVAAAGIAGAIVMSVVLWGDRQEAFAGGLRADRFSLLLNCLFLTAALATLALAWREPAAVDRRGEYAGLVLIAVTGMMLVAGAGDLISIFLGVEILSVSLYVLCALEVWRERSLESGLKYLITGAVGAAILLYGLTLLFGATGATDLATIGRELAGATFTGEPLVVAAMALIAAGTIQGAEAVLYYLLAYAAMTLAAFAVVIVREREVVDGDELAALRGYGRARPVLGVAMAVAMLSLAGFPPLSGFVGKFLLFGAAVEADLVWLAIVGALGSVVSLAYYLRVVAVMWLAGEEPAKLLRMPGPVAIATVTSGVAVVALALMASPVLDACRGAAQALLAP